MCGGRSTVPVRPDGRGGHPAHRIVVATHVQRLRQDQADRAPRARIVRKTRDATAGLTLTRLADGSGNVSFAGATCGAGPQWAREPLDVTIVAGSVQLSRDGQVIRVHPIRHPLPRAGRLRQPPGPWPPKELRHLLCKPATGTRMLPHPLTTHRSRAGSRCAGCG